MIRFLLNQLSLHRTATALLMALLSAQTAWADITISTPAEWDAFATAVNGGTSYSGQTVTLANDITVSTMVGTSDHKFTGTFYGGGHTLTFNATATANDCAPFAYIDGATFRCLKVAGTISTGYKYAAGIAAHSSGNCKIRNCQSSVTINSSISGDGTHAGFVAVHESGTLTITNCLFDGSISGGTTTNCGGFVGWRSDGTLTFDHCLMAGTMAISQTDGSALYNRNSSSALNNCYYDGSKNYGSIITQGDATTATGSDLLALLGSGWEVSGSSVVPIMDAKNLATAIISGIDRYYSNTGQEIKPEPTVTDADGTDLTKDTHYTVVWSGDGKTDGSYTLTITGIGDYIGSQTVGYIIRTTEIIGTHTFEVGNDDEGKYYKVNKKSDLAAIATYVNDNSENTCEGMRFKQTADITLSGEWTPIGKKVSDVYYKFMGTYDGAGYKINSLTIESDKNRIGLFGVISHGVVKNVNIVDCNIRGGEAVGGIAGHNYTGGTIENCTVSGEIKAGKTSSEYFGGICGYSLGTIKNCTNLATIKDTNSRKINYSGGIAGVNNGSITDCFTVGTFNKVNKKSTNIGVVVGQNKEKGTIGGTYYYASTDTYPVVAENNNTTEGCVDARRLYTLSISGLTIVGTHFIIGGQTYCTDVDGCYFAIADEQDLIDLAEYMRGGRNRSCEGLTFKMTADLDFTNMPDDCHDNKNYGKGNFLPIGMDGYDFRGHFDGQGHTITGLRFDYPYTSVGLFSVIGFPETIIEGVTLVRPNFYGYGNVGGIVGILHAGTVRNCAVVNGTIRASILGGDVGGIVGLSGDYSSTDVKTISGCTVVGTTVGTQNEIGIIVGKNDDDAALTISGCTYHNPSDLPVCGVGNYTDGGGNQQVYQARLADGLTASTAQYSYGNDYYFADGATVTLDNNRPDYLFDGYTSSDVTISNGTFTMPDKDVTISAQWIYNLTEANGITDAIATEISGKAMQFARTFKGGKYSTVCLPFDYKPGTEGEYYSFTDMTKENNEYVATMTQVNALTANTPYVFKAEGESDVEVNFSGTAATTIAAGETTSNDWQFKGTYQRLVYGTDPMTGHVYGFASKTKEVDGVTVQAGEFVHAKDGASVPPMRCYLLYKNGQQFAGARAMTRGEEGDAPQSITVRFVGSNGSTTAIGTIDIETGEVTIDSWYDLNGRRLPAKPTKKGLYIHNGQKIIIE